MKITVGRLKTIINEELEQFQEKHLEPGDPGHDKDYEEKYGDMETHEEILSRLEDILEEWEEKEYDSDKDRWEEYYEDIEDLVSEFREELRDEPEDDEDDDAEPKKKNGREVITGEKAKSLEEIIKQEIMGMLQEEEEILDNPPPPSQKSSKYAKMATAASAPVASSSTSVKPKLDESKDHPGKACKEAHSDASHEEWLKTKKKGPSAKITLSTKQEKKMDTDKVGDIDAEDMKNLRAKKKKGKGKPKDKKKKSKDKKKKSKDKKSSEKKPKNSGKNWPY